MPFNRWKSWYPKSWALNVFQAHHTELNNFYWSNVAASREALNISSKHKDTEQTPIVFPSLGIDAKKFNHSLLKWKNCYNGFQNWSRVAGAVALSGYFEVYIRCIVAAALESDPAVTLGVSKKIDGVALVKTRSDYSFADKAEWVAEGDWSKRINSYNKLFGHVPKEVSQAIGDLEKLRKLRNDAAHAFGRPSKEYFDRIHAELEIQHIVDESKLINWLGTVEKVANAIDKHLLQTHIGSYELIKYYVQWKSKNQTTGSNEINRFKQAVGRFDVGSGGGPSKDYLREMMDYYKNVTP